jgi:hypothetical protein
MNSRPGNPRWNARADLNHDHKVNVLDLQLVLYGLKNQDCDSTR